VVVFGGRKRGRSKGVRGRWDGGWGTRRWEFGTKRNGSDGVFVVWESEKGK